MNEARLSILLLCDEDPHHANAISDHIRAFLKLSRHRVKIFNPMWLTSSPLDLDEFDVVVIHYSLCIIFDHFLSADFKQKLSRFQGLKVQFIQDDYRWVDRISTAMREIGIHVLFTLVPDGEIPKIWDQRRLPEVTKITTLTGYVPDRMRHLETPPIKSRPLDIGYRGRILPFWLGRLGQEKVWIAQGVLRYAEHYGWRCDIAWREEDRIYGKKWDEFISSCRTTLGTESGASIADFDGSIERNVREFLSENPGVGFEEVHQSLLAKHEDNVRTNVISPKLFEAIALRTALILYPGEYSGVLRPWDHYIPLQKDFSNIDEVAEKLRDVDFLQRITDRAHDEIIGSGRYSYQALIQQFDEAIEKYRRPHQRKRLKAKYYLSLADRRAHLVCAGAISPEVGGVFARVWLSIARAGVNMVPRALFKLFLFTKLMISNPGYVRLLHDRIRHADCSRSALLKEIFLLALLRDVRREGIAETWRPFLVCEQYDSGQGKLTFKSVSLDYYTGMTAEMVAKEQSIHGPLAWNELEAALRDNQVREITLDNSALGPCIPYPLMSYVIFDVFITNEAPYIYRFESVLPVSRETRHTSVSRSPAR